MIIGSYWSAGFIPIAIGAPITIGIQSGNYRTAALQDEENLTQFKIKHKICRSLPDPLTDLTQVFFLNKYNFFYNEINSLSLNVYFESSIKT